jgi:hypothetical protein
VGHGGRGLKVPLRRELDTEERVALAMKSSVRLFGETGCPRYCDSNDHNGNGHLLCVHWSERAAP